jgi:hypothetical protein
MSSKKAQTIGTLLVLCLVGGCAAIAAKESTRGNPVKAHSVWQGTYDQTGWGIYPMILFIKSRTGDAFEGTTWYPTLGNGLLRVSGQVKPDGVITFTEEEIIYGRNFFIGCVYTASLAGNTLKGLSTREGREPHHFVLKLAD